MMKRYRLRKCSTASLPISSSRKRTLNPMKRLKKKLDWWWTGTSPSRCDDLNMKDKLVKNY